MKPDFKPETATATATAIVLTNIVATHATRRVSGLSDKNVAGYKMANCVSMVNVIFGLHMSATNQQLLLLSVVRGDWNKAEPSQQQWIKWIQPASQPHN